MTKKVLGLFVTLSLVLLLVACVPSSAIQESFEEQALDYKIHLKALTLSGYLDTVDSKYVFYTQLEGENKPYRYETNRHIFAYSDDQYNALFSKLGIKERDFYCLPSFDSFMKNTIIDTEHRLKTVTFHADFSSNTGQLANVPTLHGDRFTVGRYTVLDNKKFASGQIHTNLDFDEFLDERGIFTYEMYLQHVFQKINHEQMDALIIERAERSINLIDIVKYKFGHYYVPSEIFWPSGVELPASGHYCTVSKLVEFENATSGFQGIITDAATITDLNGEEQFTTFAPTNAVIEEALEQDRNAFKTINSGNANDQILRDHTVAGSYTFAELRDRAPFTLESLSGNKLRVVSDGTRVFVNGFELTNPDMGATNGFVHNIEGILYDKERGLGRNFVDVMTGVEELSTFIDHIEVLALETQLRTDELTILATTKKGYEAWLSASGLSIDNPLDHDIIIETILSQIIGGAYSKEQLLDITQNAPVQFETLVEGVLITISQDAEEALYADGVLIPFNPKEASNGFVYEIDDVLIPEEPILIFDLIASLEEISRFDELLDILARNAIFFNAESYTIFTPLNDPILDWMIETNIDIFSSNHIDQVVAFVYAHTAADVYTRQELLALSLNQPYHIESLLPNVSISITQDTEGKLYANGVLIVDSYDAINGAVHTLNGIIEPESTNTLLDTLNLAGAFTIFIQLLEHVSLESLLTQLTPMHTLVAPTDDAFESLMLELQIDFNGLLALEGLENILKYHFFPGVVSMDNLKNLYNDGLTSLDTLLNDRFILIGQDLERQITLNGYHLSPIYGAVDNGYLYFIETVLIPEPLDEEPVMGNLMEILTDGGVFQIFVQALQTTGLDESLTGTESFTIFAPLDGYFTVKMIQEDITLETLLADPALFEFLRSHIVIGTWDADSLKALLLSGQNTIFALNNTPLVITQDGDYLFINGKDIIVPNMFATNGVVHSMAGFLVE